jgi:hypothetical protein
MMKKLFIVLLLCTAAAFQAYAGTIESLTGKVDVMINGAWKTATVGMTIADGTKIMTGMDSTVKIKTTGGFFQVKELSMVTFREQTAENTSHQQVEVDMGTVNVQFQRVQGANTSFRVQTPRGTASVRGTWEEVTYYPMTGMSVTVIEGSIIVVDLNGNSLTLSQDQIAQVSQSGITSTDDLLKQYFGDFSNLYLDDISKEQFNQMLQNL